MASGGEGSVRVGVVGASGYTGAELLRICALHPQLSVAIATAERRAGDRLASVFPALAGAYPELELVAPDVEALVGLDIVFLALPHGTASRYVAALVDRVGLVVDLSADHRFRDPEIYPRWYGKPHERPDLLGRAVYGIPERHRDELPGARLIAVPGCYPTAAALALGPLVDHDVIERRGIVVDAASGVSGAGREPTDGTHFGTIDGSFAAYGLLTHRHTPEIEQELGSEVIFTPHLAPMSRGILATCYARPASELPDDAALGSLFSAAYGGEPFVTVADTPPRTKETLGSNAARVHVRSDPRTGWVVALCALDNLGKGAAGQAIQCANAALGLGETAGLAVAGVWP